MGEIKKDPLSDGAGFLYRTAFFLAQDDIETALLMAAKANERIKSPVVKKLTESLKEVALDLKNKRKRNNIGEKFLDQYTLILIELKKKYHI